LDNLHKNSTVSVCIVTYNSATDIEDCLHAVQKQSFSALRTIVVDNASTDRTREIVAKFGDSVQLIVNTVNNGFAGGQNQAIAMAGSDYVLVLNPDVVLESDYISSLVAFMDKHPQVGSATGQLVLADRPDRMDSAGLALRLDRNAVDLAAGEPVSSWTESREVFGVSGAAAFYRMRMIEEVSYDGQFFDETYFAYKEDVDVAWRARHLGWSPWSVPEAKAKHRRGWQRKNRQSIPLFVRRHSYQNRFYTLFKNEPLSWRLFGTIPIILAVEAAKLGYILVRERGLLASWPVIFRKLPAMLRKRRWMNRKKKAKFVEH
jgi:GT2 family glycosyltransferase